MLVLLEARRFRNLEPLAWRPGAGRHLLLGGNGAGKTSLLEAVYAVATTRSFRTPRLSECVQHGAGGFHLAAEVETVARARLEVGWGPEGLERAVNGSRGSLAEHLEPLPVVAWNAGEAEVLTGSPRRRRRFMDRGVVSARTGTLDALRRYRQALGQKRELLAGGDRPGRGPADALGAWNGVLAEAAAEVARLRAAYVETLTEAFELVRSEILDAQAALGEEAQGLRLPEIDLVYRPSPANALDGAAAIEERLGRALDDERRRGIPLLGPHRDDLEILWGGRPVTEVASAGEIKALSVALLAAHGRCVEAAGKTPVYLLDDLDAELAPGTLAAAWAAFEGAEQVMASSNRPAVWEGLVVDSRWKLREGRLERT